MPSDLMFRTMGAVHRGLYRLSGGKLGGRMKKVPILLLTTTGRKSGRKRTVPLMYAAAADARKTQASPISTGVAMRCIGTVLPTAAIPASSP